VPQLLPHKGPDVRGGARTLLCEAIHLLFVFQFVPSKKLESAKFVTNEAIFTWGARKGTSFK